MKRLMVLTGGLVFVAIGGFTWCERMGWLTEGHMHAWVADAGWLGAVAGVALLAGDVVLPVPSSLVMILHGVAFGWAGGTALSVLGSMGAAALGYFLGRTVGSRGAVIAGGTEEDIAWLSRFLNRFGAYAVMGSRPVPIVAEVVTCLAGYGRMPPGKFWIAVAAGSVPLSAVYAWWGAHQGSGQWLLPTLIGAVVVPMGGWWVAHVFTRPSPPLSNASADPGTR